MIEARNLTRLYGSLCAVSNMSFTVPKGEILGLLGPNGAGKTTTMRMVTGFPKPTSGSVIVADHNITDEPLSRKRLAGYLPESAPLYAEMRSKGNRIRQLDASVCNNSSVNCHERSTPPVYRNHRRVWGCEPGGSARTRRGRVARPTRGGYAAHEPSASFMLETMTNLEISDVVSVSDDPARFDLDNDNRLRVRLVGNGDELRVIDIGRRAATRGHTFIAPPGDNRIVQARGELRVVFDRGVDVLRDKSVLSFDPATITELVITRTLDPPRPEVVRVIRADIRNPVVGSTADWRPDPYAVTPWPR